MLTQKHRKRLAKEARKLAMECVEGTAPEMYVGESFKYTPFGLPIGPGCALGHVIWRSGLRTDHGMFAKGFASVVTQANDEALTQPDRHSRLVFPLLLLADALEESKWWSANFAPKF